MKKFQFSLMKLLEVRQEKEKIAQKELQEAHLFWLAQLSSLEQLEKQCLLEQTEISEARQKGASVEILTTHDAFLRMIQHKIILQKAQVQRALQGVEEQRQFLVMAVQRRKVIENLYEKKWHEWEHAHNESERTFLDELATLRYNFEKRKTDL